MARKDVVVFVQPGCAPCHGAGKFLRERGVEFGSDGLLVKRRVEVLLASRLVVADLPLCASRG